MIAGIFISLVLLSAVFWRLTDDGDDHIHESVRIATSSDPHDDEPDEHARAFAHDP